jgi:hypothetical protein
MSNEFETFQKECKGYLKKIKYLCSDRDFGDAALNARKLTESVLIYYFKKNLEQSKLPRKTEISALVAELSNNKLKPPRHIMDFIRYMQSTGNVGAHHQEKVLFQNAHIEMLKHSATGLCVWAFNDFSDDISLWDDTADINSMLKEEKIIKLSDINAQRLNQYDEYLNAENEKNDGFLQDNQENRIEELDYLGDEIDLLLENLLSILVNYERIVESDNYFTKLKQNHEQIQHDTKHSIHNQKNNQIYPFKEPIEIGALEAGKINAMGAYNHHGETIDLIGKMIHVPDLIRNPSQHKNQKIETFIDAKTYFGEECPSCKSSKLLGLVLITHYTHIHVAHCCNRISVRILDDLSDFFEE